MPWGAGADGWAGDSQQKHTNQSQRGREVRDWEGEEQRGARREVGVGNSKIAPMRHVRRMGVYSRVAVEREEGGRGRGGGGQPS